MLERANLADVYACVWSLLKTGSGMVSFQYINCSKRVPNWPNSVTVVGIKALIVLRTSRMISYPDRVIPMSLSIWPSWLDFSFSPICRRAVLSLLQAFWLLVLEEALEEITVTSKPDWLRVVRQMKLPRIWSNFTDKSNGWILVYNLMRPSSSFSAAVVVVVIRTVMSKHWSNLMIPSLISFDIIVVVMTL